MQYMRGMAKGAAVAMKQVGTAVQHQVSNSDQIQEMQAAGAQLLDAGSSFLFGADEGLTDLGTLTESGPAKGLGDWFNEQGDDPGHDAIRSGEGETVAGPPAPAAYKAGARVRNGELQGGVTRTTTIGEAKAILGVQLGTDGTYGGTAGVRKDEAGVIAGATVDFDSNGSLEGVAGRMALEAGPYTVKASGGVVQSVTDVLPTDDGRFEVRWHSAAGANGELSGELSAALQSGVGKSELLALTGSRTFASAEEAAEFRAELDALQMLEQGADVETLKGMKAGEKIVTQLAKESGLNGAFASIVGAEADVALQNHKNIEIECVEDGVVQATVASGYGVEGSAGLIGTPWIGLGGKLGYGHDTDVQATFDLNKPGVAEAFEVFQATGRLPETVPAGVELVQAESSATESWGSDWTLPLGPSWTTPGYASGTYDYSATEGAFERDGESGQFGEATRMEATQYMDPIFGTVLDAGSQSHVLRHEVVEGQTTHLSSESRYQGRDAVAHAMDDRYSNVSYEGSHLRYGSQAADITIRTEHAPETFDQLGAAEWFERVGDQAPKGAPQFAESAEALDFAVCNGIAEGVADDNYAQFLEHAAKGGGDCFEYLRNNDAGDKTRVGTTNLLPRIEALAAQTTELQEAELRGELDRDAAVRELVRAHGLRAEVLAGGVPRGVSGVEEIERRIHDLNRIIGG